MGLRYLELGDHALVSWSPSPSDRPINNKSLFVLMAQALFVSVSVTFVAGLCRRGQRHNCSLDVCTWSHYAATESVQEPALSQL